MQKNIIVTLLKFNLNLNNISLLVAESNEPNDTDQEEDSGEDCPGPLKYLGDNVYLAKKIVSERVHKNQKQYQIKWHKWPKKSNTWEPLDNILHEDLLAEYKRGKEPGGRRAVESMKKRKKRKYTKQIWDRKQKKRSQAPSMMLSDAPSSSIATNELMRQPEVDENLAPNANSTNKTALTTTIEEVIEPTDAEDLPIEEPFLDIDQIAVNLDEPDEDGEPEIEEVNFDELSFSLSELGDYRDGNEDIEDEIEYMWSLMAISRAFLIKALFMLHMLPFFITFHPTLLFPDLILL